METLKYHIISPEQTLVIRRGDNGYRVDSFSPYRDSTPGWIHHEEYFQQPNDVEGSEGYCRKLKELLYFVLEELGEYGSSYHTHRVMIEVDNGKPTFAVCKNCGLTVDINQGED